jgi:hypothetical protein
MKTLIDEEAGALPARNANYHVRSRPKAELRKAYRRKAFERAEKSPSLAMAYPQLETLSMDLLYFDREIVSFGHGLRYRANLETAKSMLQFTCPCTLCHRGGFDLSNELSSAIAERRKALDGEVHCRGSRDQESGKTVPCESILHFKMILTFKASKLARRGAVARESRVPTISSPKSSPAIRSRYCE